MIGNLGRMAALVAAVVGFGPAVLAAQAPTSISGHVTDAARPIENVSVSIPELRVGAYTDATGRYLISAPAAAISKHTAIFEVENRGCG